MVFQEESDQDFFQLSFAHLSVELWVSQGYTWGAIGMDGYLHSSQQLQYIVEASVGSRTDPCALLGGLVCCW